jgi:ATP synthase protein I
LLAGLLIGAGIGWTIDQWLGTIPWFLIIFFLLGGAAGILNLWRVVTGKGLKIGYFK